MNQSEETPKESSSTLSPEFVKDLRGRLDLNQEEMAELLDVCLGTIHRWETGKSEPRDKRMHQLQVLERKVREFGGETVKNGINAWMTFAPRMIGELGASIELLLENSFSRWVDTLRSSANKMITQIPESDLQPEESDGENDSEE